MHTIAGKVGRSKGCTRQKEVGLGNSAKSQPLWCYWREFQEKPEHPPACFVCKVEPSVSTEDPVLLLLPLRR
jgi:hypothetical protein